MNQKINELDAQRNKYYFLAITALAVASIYGLIAMATGNRSLHTGAYIVMPAGMAISALMIYKTRGYSIELDRVLSQAAANRS